MTPNGRVTKGHDAPLDTFRVLRIRLNSTSDISLSAAGRIRSAFSQVAKSVKLREQA
jgi:hypothetical protein